MLTTRWGTDGLYLVNSQLPTSNSQGTPNSQLRNADISRALRESRATPRTQAAASHSSRSRLGSCPPPLVASEESDQLRRGRAVARAGINRARRRELRSWELSQTHSSAVLMPWIQRCPARQSVAHGRRRPADRLLLAALAVLEWRARNAALAGLTARSRSRPWSPACRCRRRSRPPHTAPFTVLPIG